MQHPEGAERSAPGRAAAGARRCFQLYSNRRHTLHLTQASPAAWATKMLEQENSLQMSNSRSSPREERAIHPEPARRIAHPSFTPFFRLPVEYIARAATPRRLSR